LDNFSHGCRKMDARPSLKISLPNINQFSHSSCQKSSLRSLHEKPLDFLRKTLDLIFYRSVESIFLKIIVETLYVLEIYHTNFQSDALLFDKDIHHQTWHASLRSLPLRSLQNWHRWSTAFKSKIYVFVRMISARNYRTLSKLFIFYST